MSMGLLALIVFMILFQPFSVLTIVLGAWGVLHLIGSATQQWIVMSIAHIPLMVIAASGLWNGRFGWTSIVLYVLVLAYTVCVIGATVEHFRNR